MKVISKLVLTIETDTETGETSLIKREVLNDDIKTKSSFKKILEGETPKLQLNANNFAINQAACELLGVNSGDTLYINYPKKDDKYVPAIGKSEAFSVKAGNKITKSLTVSYRGAANERLAEYGTNFEFIESERPGIFYLKGDKVIIPENTIEIDDSFELDDLEDITLDLNESTDISTIDLTL